MDVMFIIAPIMLIVIFGISGMLLYKDFQMRKNKKKGISSPNSGLISKKTYLKMYRRYEDIFFTKEGIRRVHYKLAELSVYSKQEVMVKSVVIYTVSITTFLGITLGGIIVFRDIFTVILVFVFALIMKNVLVDKQIDAIHFKMLNQLLKALSSVRQSYLQLGVISDAIVEAQVGSLLHRAFEEIHLILTASDGEKRLEEFYAATPFKLLQTFSGVCYILNNAGDTKLDNGSSNFMQAMGMMHTEVQMEVQRLVLQKARFGALEYLPVAPLLAIKFIETFFSSVIPGTSIIYNGPIGYVSKVVIILFGIIGYTTITKINSTVIVKKDDKSKLMKKILDIHAINNMIENILPKKIKKIRRLERLLKAALSRKNIKDLYVSKVVYFFVAFFMSIFFIFFSVELGKEFILNNIKEVSLVAGEELDEEGIRIRRQMDEIYLNTHPMMSKRKTEEFVKARLPSLPEFDKQAQVHRLQTKYTSYYNTYFKWWMLVICYIIALIAWYFPEVMLRARIWLLKAEAEEDVLQLQTMITILMNTSIDTMDTLYWLQRQSQVHKNMLIDAYHEYASNPEMALNRLKAKATLPTFKNIAEKLLLTIDQISLSDAFNDLVSERDHVLRIREITQKATLNKKRAFVSPLAMAPLAITAVAYILVPLGILGFKEFMTAMENLNM